jgi:hypothetical protein
MRYSDNCLVQLLPSADVGGEPSEYPELEDENIRQALNYAASYLDDRIVELPVTYATDS